MIMSRRPKVTIYTPCYNYAQYLRESVESVLSQIYDSWELLLINDGAVDDSQAIMDEYARSHPDKIRTFSFDQNQGLARCANFALEEARGDYIMRLDADDYLDQSALLVMISYLEKRPDVDLLYPNYIYVDRNGNYMGTELRKKIGVDAQLLDLPAHGACTMIRKRALKSIGGYSSDLKAQDGYDIWLKFLRGHKIDNVETPLFFYRQHATSLSSNKKKIMEARMDIMRRSANGANNGIKPSVGAVVPVKNSYAEMPNIALNPFLDKPLIDYTVELAVANQDIDFVIVTTDDPAVVEHCKKFPGVYAFNRPQSLLRDDVMMIEIVNHALKVMEEEHDVYMDAVATLGVHSPLRTSEDVSNAIDALKLFKVDSVLSVYEDHDLHMVHGEYGLTPINPGAWQRLRHEREALYVPNGAVEVRWRDVITGKDMYGKKIGHTVMPRDRSFQLRNSISKELMEVIMLHLMDNTPHVSFDGDACREFPCLTGLKKHQ